MKRIFNALIYSLHGLVAAWRDEAAFRQVTVLAVFGIVLALTWPLSNVARALLIGAHALTLIVELLNTAIEAAIDRIGEERHPLSKKAKDCGSAAQTVMLALLLALWVAALCGAL